MPIVRRSKIRKDLFGENDLDLSRSYHNLGVAYFAKGNYDCCCRKFESGVKLIRKSNKNQTLVAQTYQELGIVSLNSGDLSKGLEYQASCRRHIWKTMKKISSF